MFFPFLLPQRPNANSTSFPSQRLATERSSEFQKYPSSSIKVVRRHQQLETQFIRNRHISHACTSLVLFIVVKVLDDFAQDNSIDIFETTDPCSCFTEATWVGES